MRFAFIVLSALLLVLSSSVLANDSLLEWSPEMAQMLAQEGWERHTPRPLEPVVGYAIHFVELSGEMVESLTPQLKIRSIRSEEAGWEVSWDASLLEALTVTAPHYQLELEGAGEYGGTQAFYSSWVITVGAKPLDVSLSEMNLTTQDEDNLFQIRLTPMEIDAVNQRVQTQIALRFRGDLGTVSQVELTSWVGSEADAPVAVVAISRTASAAEQKRYFALFVSGFVIQVDQIPWDSTIVPIGNLAGLEKVFAKEEVKPALPPSHFRFGLAYGSNGLEGYLSGRYASESSELTGQFYYGPVLDYNFTGRWRIHEYLCLLAAVENQPEQLLPVIRLGIGDEVWLTSDFKLHADLYAVEIAARDSSTNEPPVTTEPKLEFGCTYQGELWSVSYQGTIDQGELSHTMKGTLSLDEQCSLEAAYRYSEKEKHRVTFGLKIPTY